MISVISPVYNECENIDELCRRIIAACEKAKLVFEIIIVDDGSTDQTKTRLASLREKDKRIKYISLSRNFGHQGAILAGMYSAIGDAVISLDGDLQHPPELIPEMVEHWKQGYDVIYTIKKVENRKKDLLFMLKFMFYKLINRISELSLAYGQTDFRLLDRKVIEILKTIPEKNLFLRGLVDWVGFSQKGITYEVSQRTQGTSKFSYISRFRFALDGIFSFSTIPLKLFLYLGLSVAFFCLIYGCYSFVHGSINYFFYGRLLLPQGWSTLAFSITFLGAVQLIGIGCLGEYIGRIHIQTKERPSFIIKETALEAPGFADGEQAGKE